MADKSLLNKQGRDKAWEDTFEEPVSFDHKPTAEEIFDLRLESVAQAQLAKAFKRIEELFADGSQMTTFIRKRDGRAGVEDCKLLIAAEWRALVEGG